MLDARVCASAFARLIVLVFPLQMWCVRAVGIGVAVFEAAVYWLDSVLVCSIDLRDCCNFCVQRIKANITIDKEYRTVFQDTMLRNNLRHTEADVS